ncbi:MAG: hypothetical protein V2B13_15315 [Pseudomonadota bacterium]
MLKFPDGTKARVVGLDEILADLYSEGRQENQETGEEIMNRLEAKKNYIPSSSLIRREYRRLLLKEYREYVKDRIGK